MPIYEYQCTQCGDTVDILQKLTDPEPEGCEKCGARGTLHRLVSRTSFVLKGGGWYSDLYGSPKKAGEQKAGEQKTGEQKTGEQKTGEQKAPEKKKDEGGPKDSAKPSTDSSKPGAAA